MLVPAFGAALALLPGHPAGAGCHSPFPAGVIYGPVSSVSYPVSSPVVSYHAPDYHEHVHKVVVVQEKVVFPFAAAYELFQFVAPPTTPPPVVLAAPAPLQPVAQPVAAPVAAPCVPCAAAAAPAPPPCPAAVQAPPCPQAQAAATAGLEARLARIEAALLRLSGGTPGDAGPPPASDYGTSPGPGPGSAPGMNPAYARPGADLASALGVLQKHQCAQCHTAPGRDGIILYSAAGEWAPEGVTWGDIYRSMRSGKMPRGSPQKANAEELAVVKAMADSEVR